MGGGKRERGLSFQFVCQHLHVRISFFSFSIICNFSFNRPTEFDLEGTSNGNTAEDPLPKKEELQTQVTESEKSPPCIVPQPAESKKDQHSSVSSAFSLSLPQWGGLLGYDLFQEVSY